MSFEFDLAIDFSISAIESIARAMGMIRNAPECLVTAAQSDGRDEEEASIQQGNETKNGNKNKKFFFFVHFFFFLLSLQLFLLLHPGFDDDSKISISITFDNFFSLSLVLSSNYMVRADRTHRLEPTKPDNLQ